MRIANFIDLPYPDGLVTFASETTGRFRRFTRDATAYRLAVELRFTQARTADVELCVG